MKFYRNQKLGETLHFAQLDHSTNKLCNSNWTTPSCRSPSQDKQINV